MAGSDYFKCSRCSKRLFYDAEMDYGDTRAIAALCGPCDLFYTLKVVKRPMAKKSVKED